MSLLERVHAAFAPGGVLPQAAPHFLPRAGQTEMSLAIARTIASGGALVVEAGTGVGKTFAYLVPALLSGERTLLSTATKTLQDQLFGRDLPQLVQALGLPTRVALLKGRANYLCTQRLSAARYHPLGADRATQATLAKIERWGQTTVTGDLAELSGLDERSPVIPLVTSTRDNCLGSQCPDFKTCHVNAARRVAMAADVVVINHHLFFADLAVRESGVAELLPNAKVVVFDEAHQMNETGVQFLGTQWSTAQCIDFSRDLLAGGLQQARGMLDWQALASTLERSARDLRLVVGPGSGSRLQWRERVPDGVSPQEWDTAVAAVMAALVAVCTGIEPLRASAPELDRLAERAQGLRERLQQFEKSGPADTVRWLDVGMQLRLVESPLDIAEAVRTRMLDAEDGPPSGRAWVFTSATLGTDDRLGWFTEPCGLSAAETLRVGSPFDYPRQAGLYVPRDMPRPADPAHSVHVAALVREAAGVLGGRTMVLTTSLRALRAIGEGLQAQPPAGVEVLVQGQSPKRELIERFRAGAMPGQPGRVLVASVSFWEGVDVPGEALQLVVIDKLPFPPPNEPLVQARAERLEQAGRSAFNEHHLPEAAIALKQGAGRLIRSETDEGLLVIADNRLLTLGYGRKLLQALPPMRQLSSAAEFRQALAGLTRTSTTGLT